MHLRPHVTRINQNVHTTWLCSVVVLDSITYFTSKCCCLLHFSRPHRTIFLPQRVFDCWYSTDGDILKQFWAWCMKQTGAIWAPYRLKRFTAFSSSISLVNHARFNSGPVHNRASRRKAPFMLHQAEDCMKQWINYRSVGMTPIYSGMILTDRLMLSSMILIRSASATTSYGYHQLWGHLGGPESTLR